MMGFDDEHHVAYVKKENNKQPRALNLKEVWYSVYTN
jgi:hypothetical protein